MGQTPTFSFTFDIGPAAGPAPDPQLALPRGGRPDVDRALPWLWARIQGQVLPPPFHSNRPASAVTAKLMQLATVSTSRWPSIAVKSG